MNEPKDRNVKLRYNIVTAFIYIIGIILLIRLFNLQIIHGEEYREESNTRLTRESVLEAARGNISDSTGNKLATTKLGYSLELYRTKIDTQELNNTLLRIVKILENNNDSYIDTFPIKIEPFEFTIGEEAQIKWKEKNKIDKNKTAEECFYIFKEKYKIENEDIKETRKIMTLRYLVAQNGYSSIRSVELATDISSLSLAQLNEQSSEFPGVNVKTKAIRSYPSGTLASHILGYTSSINQDELEGKEDRYSQSDIIGKTGIEYIMEDYLKGKNGVKQIYMSIDGTITGEDVAKEATAGSDVILTIDANLQQVMQDTLKNSIESIQNSEKVKVTGASAVVMNVNNGEVLAMASYPDFNPQDFVGGISKEKWNYYTKESESEYAKMHPFVNRAISSPSSPGSTYKMVTALAGLETGKITTKEKINDVGIYKFAIDYNPI